MQFSVGIETKNRNYRSHVGRFARRQSPKSNDWTLGRSRIGVILDLRACPIVHPIVFFQSKHHESLLIMQLSPAAIGRKGKGERGGEAVPGPINKEIDK